MLRSLLPAAAAAALVLLLPAAAQALPAPFPEGTNWLLSGDEMLVAPDPTPAYDSYAGTETVSASGRFVAFSSQSDALSAEDDDRTTQIYVKDRDTGDVTLVSRRSGTAGAVATGDCSSPAISADGTRVAFSCADALDAADTDANYDIYARTWQAPDPVTTFVSRKPALGPGTDDSVYGSSLSATGEYVAFADYGPLVAADTNDDADIYRRRIGSGDPVVLVSRKAGGGVVGDGESTNPSISDDGERIAFDSVATNLGPGVGTHRNVFVATPADNTLTLASSPNTVTTYPNADSGAPSISGNGKVVAFESGATNLQDGDVTPGYDVHVRTLATAATTWASPGANDYAGQPVLGVDGSVVSFSSYATTLDPADTDPSSSVFVRDGGVTRLASRRDGATGADAHEDATGGALSADGKIVVFTTDKTALTPDADGDVAAVYARDRAATTTRLVSRPAGSGPFVNAGGAASIAVNGHPSISADGSRVVLMLSRQGQRTAVVRDTRTGARVVAGRADGADGAIDPKAASASISADGGRVVWATSTRVDPVLDTDDQDDIYVRDLATARTLLASRADGPDGADSDKGNYAPSLDADGSRVLFFSYALNLGDGPLGGFGNVHVRDLATGRTLLASGKDGVAQIGGNASADSAASISADGSRVAFVTRATDLGDGDVDPQDDVHLRDLAAGTTRLISGNPGGAAGNGSATEPTISADGTRVAFTSSATNLIDDFPANDNAYVRDLAVNTLTMVSRSTAGTPAAKSSRDALISADGRFVLFATASQDLGATFPVNAGNQLFLRDLAPGTTSLASRDAGGAPVAGNLGDAALSADAACLVFVSARAVIAQPVSPDFEQVYLRGLRPGCVPALPAAAPAPTPPAITTLAPPVVKDSKAPAFSKVSLSRRRFRIAAKTTALAARTGAGTTLRFTLSEAARVTVTVERERPGRTSGGACKIVRKSPKRGTCTAYAKDATLTRKVLAKGARSLSFSGRLGKKKLASGRHRLTLRATDAAGNRSKPVTLTFTVVKR